MNEQLLSEWPVVQNGLFFLFLFIFFVTAFLLGSNRHLFASMLHGLFREQEKGGAFPEIIHNEFVGKLTLCLQTVLTASIIVYCILSRVLPLPFESTSHFLYLLGGTIVCLIVALLYKFLTYFLIEYIFFSKEDAQLWNSQYFAIISLSGVVLFLPAMLIFYWTTAFHVCLYASLFYLLFIKVLMVYKIYTIFFHQKSPLLYFILYLCGQELLPLFFVAKALVYFYST
jgi:hypothetical protein